MNTFVGEYSNERIQYCRIKNAHVTYIHTYMYIIGKVLQRYLRALANLRFFIASSLDSVS